MSIKTKELHSVNRWSDLMVMLNNHDPYTYEHSCRVAQLLKDFALYLHYPVQGAEVLYQIGYLHDLGKLLVPIDVLRKKGRLNNKEWECVKGHPIEGRRIAESHGVTDLFILTAIEQHHENLDGTGYPYSVSDREIYTFSRMLRIVDSYDAMVSKRQYSNSMLIAHAIEELEQWKRSWYDPFLTDRFIELIRLKEIDID
ncbi:HD-GYP domain-containing protein [Desertibacillus haloalkaliphilus]|uniref:HD-GYP domain-containing protein n=1 Tax=Desertibacillus haloalkaliphilus TaxID=1328930 RepID=UPI001C27C040|nr:HD domain-containing phosphohydrolase [Desertibacillus haloalkaliphilus]MBU8908062.1 HD domain-containing protein [Desertibacillus haloalkaliphilus]